MNNRQFTRFLLAGVLAGGMTGTMDALMAITNDVNQTSMTSKLVALLVATIVLQPVGILVGGGLFLVSGLPRFPLEHLRNVLLSLKRPRYMAPAFLLCVVSGGLVTYLGYKRGIMIDAINLRPPSLFLIFVALFLGCYRFLVPIIRRRTLVGSICLAVSLLVFAVVAPKMGALDDALSLSNRTTLARLLMAGVKARFDADNDGFSTTLCKTDCDCDDNDPKRNPAAIDIPGNGIDEDCSGADLVPLRTRPVPAGAVSEGPSINPPYNILLITIDTLRADRMHLYGYERHTTPNIDKLAQKSVWFEQARSQGPSTRHVFPVLLTGRYFTTIALKKGKKWSSLLDTNVTFAEALKKAGYRTVAVLPYFRFKEHSGFQQGFDVWEPVLDTDRDATWDPTGDLVTDRGLEHLDTLLKSDAPWLLWLHYFDPHASYVKHEDQPDFGKARPDRYDGEILYVDRQIQRFLDVFEKSDAVDETALILTSDHGEGIGLPTDHGFNYHGFSLFDSETRIPLMIRIPKVTPRKNEQTSVALIDVPPTILTLAGVEPEAMHGEPLIPYLSAHPPARRPFLMQLPEKKAQHAMVDWPYKLIWNVALNRYSLFNLEKDPHEQTDLVESEAEIARRLKQQLKLELYELSASPSP